MLARADARRIPLPAETVQCCITSPPYWGLRDYGLSAWEGGDPQCEHSLEGEGQPKGGPGNRQGYHAGRFGACPQCGAVRNDAGIGLEPRPEEYIENLVEAMREVWRVLRDDGTLWLNLGNSYASASKGTGGATPKQATNRGSFYRPLRLVHGLKEKDLVGIAWWAAFALQSDGWYLRRDIIWAKPNAMPESVRDRPTTAHEYLFLLTKQPTYYYDEEAVMSPRKLRSVWTIPTACYRGAHFAVFPERLVKPCILAGSRPGDIVLDPFCGSGTVGAVARAFGRRFVGTDLSQGYLRMARERLNGVPLGMTLL